MDVYAILGLPRVATLADIKRAYRRLARRYHPDINPGDDEAEARFKQIAEAYAILSDLERRQTYDLTGRIEISVVESVAKSYGFEGFDFSTSAPPSGAPTFGDLFAEVFGSRDPRSGGEPLRGVDLHLSIAVLFEEAVRGAERAVTVVRRETCAQCLGEGRVRSVAQPCTACQGAGSLRSVRGHMIFAKPCSRCGGTGNVHPVCRACGGHGVETRSETITVPISAGLVDGTQVRVVAKGNAGVRGGPPGDLLVVIHVAEHPVFRRDGDDLHVVVPLAVHEAALGARIDVPTLQGPARLRVPAGTQSGQRFRLNQRGVPSLRDGRPGDLVVEVRLALPRALDERSKELLRQFGELHPDNVRQELIDAVEASSSRRN